jgi:L-iditol 2-dehydrogenase
VANEWHVIRGIVAMMMDGVKGEAFLDGMKNCSRGGIFQIKGDFMTTMRAARLHGPSDMRFETLPRPGKPGPGHILLRVKAVGICGSDLHTYMDGRIGDTVLKEPLTLGHEFAGVIEEVGENAFDGGHHLLKPGMLVAVDPGQPCGYCEQCVRGHPNLCLHLHFCGYHPDPGALADFLMMPASCCFPLPAGFDAEIGALLETLGIAIHSIDLAKIRVQDSLAILGAGPIGLSILQVARLTGAHPIFVTDKFPWRLEAARKLGAIPINCDAEDPVQAIMKATEGRGVDVAIEAGWADKSVNQAAGMARMGGRLVIVGISGDDQMNIKHSTARRKGLTIRLCRRMKHTYERAIAMYARGAVDLKSLVTHRYPLEKTPEAFAMNAAYKENVLKVIIEI